MDYYEILKKVAIYTKYLLIHQYIHFINNKSLELTRIFKYDEFEFLVIFAELHKLANAFLGKKITKFCLLANQ